MSVRIERTLRSRRALSHLPAFDGALSALDGVIINTQPNAHELPSPLFDNYSRFFQVGRQRCEIICKC